MTAWKPPASLLGTWTLCPLSRESVDRAAVRHDLLLPDSKRKRLMEAKNIVGAAAAVKDGKVYWLYRAEPNNIHNSRVGLGISEDGIHFQCRPTPVLYPDEDAFKQYEWPGGTEDGPGRHARRWTLYLYLLLL